jgi:4-hydroxythreonine-4-phosphate dehydrogenase
VTRAPLAISTGDPGGVGPEISLRTALAECEHDAVVVFGDAAWLAARALELGAQPAQLVRVAAHERLELPLGKIGLADVGVAWDAEALAHRGSARGGLAQLRALDLAMAAARSGLARGLVTAPMSKAAVNLAGFEFVGHTEHLAKAAGLPDDAVTMMFLGPKLRVALVTTHVAIAELPREITRPRVLRTIRHLAEALVRDAKADGRTRAIDLVVTGLNPHAGEEGLFGDEEPRVIEPAMRDALALACVAEGRVTLRGPVPAETAFRQAAAGSIDGIVAMMHDQATIASKLLDWGQAVNVTWGLPFVRTSVDHGVAYDAAHSGKIDTEGMRSAFRLAQRLTAYAA